MIEARSYVIVGLFLLFGSRKSLPFIRRRHRDRVLHRTTYEDIVPIANFDSDVEDAFLDLSFINGPSWLNARHKATILDSAEFSNPENIYLDGDYAFVCDKTDGTKIFDVSNRESFNHVSTIQGISYDVYVEDDIAYIAENENGVSAYDISDKMNPLLVDHRPLESGWLKSVKIYNDLAVAIVKDFSMDIYDRYDLNTLIGRIPCAGTVGLSLHNGYAYLSLGYPGIWIADLSDPTDPIVVGTFNTPGYASQVEVEGDYAYVSGLESGWTILDISDPTQPVLVGYVFGSYVHQVYPRGNHAFVSSTEGTQIYDISSRMDPQLITTIRYSGTRRAIVSNSHDYKYLVFDLTTSFPRRARLARFFDMELTGTVEGALPPCKISYGVTVRASEDVDEESYVEDGFEIVYNYPPCEDTNCTEHGRCVHSLHCACESGWYGFSCDQVAADCDDWKESHPLETDYVPVLMRDEAVIKDDHLHLLFESPIVNERYDYHILIGDPDLVNDTICDSWFGDWWVMNISETSGCIITFEGEIPWNKLEQDCFWDSSASTSDVSVFQNTIYFRAKEDFGAKQRSLEWEYDVTIQIPQRVVVDVVSVEVFSPVELVAVLYDQNIDPENNSGEFKLFTNVDYPYTLEYSSIEEPCICLCESHVTIDHLDTDCDDDDDDDNDDDNECGQSWLNSLEFYVGKCQVEGVYTYNFLLKCRGAHACPYEEELVQIQTTVVSEYFCNEIEMSTDIDAVMVSCEDGLDCLVEDNGFLTTQTAYFKVNVISPQLTVSRSEVRSVWLEGHDFMGGAPMYLLIEGQLTASGVATSFGSTDDEKDPKFWFDLEVVPEGFFTVNAKVSITYDYELDDVVGGRRSLGRVGRRDGQDVEEEKYSLRTQLSVVNLYSRSEGDDDDVFISGFCDIFFSFFWMLVLSILF